MTWRPGDPQGNEAAKIKYHIVPYTRGRGLDIGCGSFKAYPHFIGVDNLNHQQQFGWEMRPDVVSEADDLSMFANQSLDFVFSSHTLEHLENTRKALKEWLRVIKPGGYLVLYLPDDALYPKVGEPGANPDHKANLSRESVIETMMGLGGWDLLVNEQRDTDNGEGQPGNEYSFFQVYKKRTDGKQLHGWKKKPKKTVAVVRYGGFGDMIQASSVLPQLKAQGYHVTMVTTPRGQDVLRHDPHIDDWLIQDTDQVPNNELRAFWDALATRYTKLINLSESVEASLLPIPGRGIYYWPDEARRAMCNHNYLEFTHKIAEVPFKPEARFYAAEDEIQWAQKERPDGYVIVWSLAGSSVHKAWPYLDAVIARLLITYPDVRIVTVGDTLCQMLESGWENEKRVIRRSGEWSIRESLAFAKHAADLVVGTETGLLNAVGLEPVPKVITLSHSTHENLTKHWTNTTVLTPSVPCFPCHRMHYGFEFCHQDEESGTAICQADISADAMYTAIRDWIRAEEAA